MTQSLLLELSDTSKQVPYTQIWSDRPAQMVTEIDRQLLAGLPATDWLFWAVFGLSLSGLVLKKTPKQTFILWLSLAPLLGMMLFRGNHGQFFNYYIAPQYYALLLASGVSLQLWQHRKLGPKILVLGSFIVTLAVGLGFGRYWPLLADPTILQYSAGQQVAALNSVRRHGQQNPTQPLGMDVFVPNLLPTQYQYLNQFLNSEHELAQAEFVVSSDHQTFYLLSEPPISEASQVEYEKWRDRMSSQAECQELSQHGIILVEVCQR